MNTIDNNDWFNAKKSIDNRKRENRNNYQNNSKQRLINIISKKFDTTTIGILDILEKEIGYMWGHGENPKHLSNDQLDFKEVWQNIRNKILDHGNGNKRAVKEEISQYTITWNRYQTQFIIRKEEDND